MIVRVSLYVPDKKVSWDNFVAGSKNGVFLFKRDYMEYHADRFSDFSLMFHDNDGDLLAIMPASIGQGVVTSHGGLTFGGIVTDKRMKAALMLDLVETLDAFLGERGVTKLVYKAIPHIYHSYPAEEDLYALFRWGARLVRRDISSTIMLNARLPLSKGRKYSIKSAQKAGLAVRQVADFDAFMAIEEELLGTKYATKPTHSASEMKFLASKFPENIKLFGAYEAGEMIAGVVVYQHKNIVHAQYIAATDTGKRMGALDLIVDHLTSTQYNDMRYFDFGISTERQGNYLNEGLIDNKQSFGGRAIVHDFYEKHIGGDSCRCGRAS